ncbi:CGI121 [[Candida] subhashii]|uniref:CGI121 n=1 Tax=[Candida] subhashii TaxID=561895 RepID=A0A8J5QGE1_9ASCO|nr:CGI121 [[Candida] subhashii]KAG7661528.1 CGI121 [[Candida] subhashii]
MSNQTITFPQFPNHSIYISLFKGLSSNSIKQIKQELVSGNKAYDYCFLNTKHIVSLEHLYSSIHRSILNYTNNNMAAKTLNTEIIFNLSPINNIVDALKNFGIREDCPNVIIIKVLPTEECTEDKISEITENLSALLGEGVEKASLDDELMFNELVDIKKLKKLYKLNDAKIDGEGKELQQRLTRLAIGACLLRGY